MGGASKERPCTKYSGRCQRVRTCLAGTTHYTCLWAAEGGNVSALNGLRALRVRRENLAGAWHGT